MKYCNIAFMMEITQLSIGCVYVLPRIFDDITVLNILILITMYTLEDQGVTLRRSFWKEKKNSQIVTSDSWTISLLHISPYFGIFNSYLRLLVI